MSALAAPLSLVAARARRRPGRWLLPALGLALATAFACAVATEGLIAGDRAARTELTGLGALQRTVQVTWQGPLTPSTDARARGLLRSLGLPTPTRVELVNPVRLGGAVVRPAAISPLTHWVGGRRAAALGPCRASDCPMLLPGDRVPGDVLAATGVRIRVAGRATLHSAAPLGFVPAGANGPPVLLTGDLAGLNALAGLSGVYRTQSWISLLGFKQLQSWEIAGLERRMQRAQAALLQTDSQFSLSAPFGALDQARTEAVAAPRRLLPAGGGALAALAVFVVLAAYGLRRDQRGELERLAVAGARVSQRITFCLGEAAALAAAALVVGIGLGIGVAALLAHHEQLPVGPVLAHSLLSPVGVAALVGGWLVATAVIGAVLAMPDGRLADVLAVAAVAALALALTRGAASGGTLPLLAAPLACVAAGVLVYRGAAALLEAGERLARRGPLPVRLALVGLARAPVAPSLAIAFIAVSTGLAGFALAYRSTLLRGTADQAADRVPLDAMVTPATNFQTPLEVAPLARWRALAGTGGAVLPARRTQATFISGGSGVTVPAVGVPAVGLPLIHGWRSSDGPASLKALAARLSPGAAVRTPGLPLLQGARRISLTAASPAAAVQVSADLRDAAGAVTQVPLGLIGPRPRTLSARLPAGSRELEALELEEPSGERATSGHQIAENPAASPQFSTTVALGPVTVRDASGRPLPSVSVNRWLGVGAAGHAGPEGSRLRVRFTASGAPGVIRPPQPSDGRPIPILVDPATAAAASRQGRIALTIDGLPIKGRIVGVLRRFPTLTDDAAGFVIADQATLAAALDASLPGQGRPDELWIDTSRPRTLRGALGEVPLNRLGASFRSTVQRQLRDEPIAVGTLGTLAAAAGLAAALAVIGLLAALAGALREPRAERDLAVQGLGPRDLRRELRLRILVAGGLGVLCGAALAVGLTGLTVAAVRAGATLEAARPPLVTIVPWAQMALCAVALLAVFAAASWVAAGVVVSGGRRAQ